MHKYSSHVRQQLKAHQATTEHTLRAAHAHMVASLKPAIDMLLRDLESAREASRNEDGDVTLTLAWLHESNRMNRLKQQITGAGNHFGITTQLTVKHAQDTAKLLGTRTAEEQIAALKGKRKR